MSGSPPLGRGFSTSVQGLDGTHSSRRAYSKIEQDPERVERGLRRATRALHEDDERLDLAAADPVEPPADEERRQLHPDRRVVRLDRRALASLCAHAVDEQPADLLDGQTLRACGGDADRGHQPAQLGLGLRAGETDARRRDPLGPDPALDLRGADPPLAVPGLVARRVALDEQRAGPAGPAGGGRRGRRSSTTTSHTKTTASHQGRSGYQWGTKLRETHRTQQH